MRKDESGRDLSGIGAPYLLRLNYDQLREVMSNPTPGPEDAQATLMLKAQIVFTTSVPSGIAFRPLRHEGGPRRRRRGDKAISIPIAGTENKTTEAVWIAALGVLLIAALGGFRS